LTDVVRLVKGATKTTTDRDRGQIVPYAPQLPLDGASTEGVTPTAWAIPSHKKAVQRTKNGTPSMGLGYGRRFLLFGAGTPVC